MVFGIASLVIEHMFGRVHEIGYHDHDNKEDPCQTEQA
jgi:hypothetical protein